MGGVVWFDYYVGCGFCFVWVNIICILFWVVVGVVGVGVVGVVGCFVFVSFCCLGGFCGGFDVIGDMGGV